MKTWQIYLKNQEFRAFNDWPNADLIELAKLSKLQAMVFDEMDHLEDEGIITYGGKTGMTPIENPRNRAIATLNGTITATMRRLGISAAHSADRETKAKRGMVERETEMNMPHEQANQGRNLI